MKITIEVPDIKYNEHNVRELLENAGIISPEYDTFWCLSLIGYNKNYILILEGVIDGEVVSKEFDISIEDLNNLFLESINYFEYDGRYGSKFELTSDESPSFYDYRKEGSLKTFLEDVVKQATTSSFEYGYLE